MTTALTIVNDAFESLAVKTANTDLTDEEVSLAIRILNRMITTWAQAGIDLGYTKISSSSDEMTVPDWTEETIVAQLAVRLAPAFEVEVSLALGGLAQVSYKTLETHFIHFSDAQMPNTLPLGAGNTIRGSSGTNFFTDTTDDDITKNNDVSITDSESVKLSQG